MGLTAESIFNRLDVNEDRKVSAGEFAQGPGIRDAEEARQAVGRIDTDEDGTLSWKEFEAAHKLRHARCAKALPATAPAGPGQRGNMNRFAQVFIMRSDRNGDGRIDKSEFRGSDSRFDLMDKNGNGYIDPEELTELHTRRMNDPKTMRERLDSGEVRRPPPWARPEGAGQPRDDDETKKAPQK